MSALEYQVEELFVRALTEGAVIAGIYSPDIVPSHYASDDEANTNALWVEAVTNDQRTDGCQAFNVTVTIGLRTLATIPAADEQAMWDAIDALVMNMGEMATSAPSAKSFAEDTFRWLLFEYSKAGEERPAANNFRHRRRMIPVQAKLI